MRLIRILVVLFVAFGVQVIAGRAQTSGACAKTSIERAAQIGLPLSSTPPEEAGWIVWANGLDLPGRCRPSRKPQYSLRSKTSSSRRRHARGLKAMSEASQPGRALAEEAVCASPEPAIGLETAGQRAKKPGRPPSVPTGHVCCIHSNCRGYGKFGSAPDHRIVGAGIDFTKNNGGHQMYRCNWCQRRFSETQGTVFFGLKTPAETVYRVLMALAEGVSIRSTARIFGERPETILLWLRRAGQHSQQVSDYMLRDLRVSQAQLDELWAFVHKKEKNLSAWEQLHTEYGDTWVWVVFDPVNKLVLSLLVGEREEDQAVGVLSQLKARLAAGCLPLFTSDQLPQYLKALLRVFGHWVQPQRQGERGRFPNPRLEAPEDLLYATVDKQKQGGHLVSVTRQVVLGNPAAIARQLEAIRPGLKINTSFIERFNLTLRHLVSRLRRKGLTFSKKREYLVWHLQLATAYYQFVRPHGSLRQRLDEPSPTRGSPKLWQPRTPTMAAGLTDHPWSMQELLAYRVPPPSAA